MRTWLVELPALAVTLLLKGYAAFIALMAILCFLMVIVQVAAWLLDLPIPWLGQPRPVSPIDGS
jgi:hypothetical protein